MIRLIISTGTKKRAWYEKFFPGRLIVTYESQDLSLQADEIIQKFFR